MNDREYVRIQDELSSAISTPDCGNRAHGRESAILCAKSFVRSIYKSGQELNIEEFSDYLSAKSVKFRKLTPLQSGYNDGLEISEEIVRSIMVVKHDPYT